MSRLIREIRFTPAFDKRSSEPGKNYGVGSVDMRWYVSGVRGVVQFALMTGWNLPHVQQERGPTRPLAYDVGYHSPEPMYEGQELIQSQCELLGGPCYYDGSSLAADEAFALLLTEGHEALWSYLEDRYRKQFAKRRAR